MAGSSRDFVVNILADQTDAERGFNSLADVAGKAAATAGAAWSALNLGEGLFGGLQIGADLADAQSTLDAQLGAFGDRSAEAGAVAGEMWRSGFVDSIDESNAAVAAVAQNLGDVDALGADTFSRTAVQAQALASAHHAEVTRVVAAAGSMLRSGLAPDAEAAFDVIATGMQTGANRGGDLLDTFEEYSVVFDQVGLSSKQALGLINQGLEAGARNGDIVADAIKEFTIIAQEAMVDPVDPAAVEAAQEQVAAAYEQSSEAIASARQQMAADVASANQQVTSAEQQLEAAQAARTQAQQDLNAATRDARQALEELADQLVSSRLGERGARLAVQQAKRALDEALTQTGEDYDPLAVKEAQLRLDQAEFSLQQQKEQVRDLRREKAQADRDGVAGSEQVQAAQESLADANRGVRQSEAELRQSRRAAERAAVDGAAAVAQAQQDAADRIAEATAALTSAQTPQLTTLGQAYATLGLDGEAVGDAVARGGRSAQRALGDVLDRLRAVEDPTQRAQLAVELFGTKAEDLQGALYALDPETAARGFDDMSNAADGVADSLNSGVNVEARATQHQLQELLGRLLGLPGADKLLVYGPAFSGIAAAIGPALGGLATWRAAQAASTAVTVPATAANTGFAASMWAVSWPVLAVVAAVALLAFGACELIKHWDDVKAWFGDFGGWLKDHWKDIAAIIFGPFGIAVRLITKHWDDIKGAVGDGIGWVWDKIKGVGGLISRGWDSLWSGITDTVGEKVDWIGDKVGSIAGFFTSIPRKIGNLARDFGDGLMRIVHTIADGVAWLWNHSVGAIGFSIPDWVPVIGGSSFSMPNITVPALATGGVALAPTLALIGEAGPEAVVPLDRYSGGTQTIVTVIELDGREVARNQRRVRARQGF